MHDCIVIGGGVMGLLTARELARSGLRVALLERGQIGMQCSQAGGGILSPLYPWAEPAVSNPLIRWCQEQYPQLATELLESTGIDPEWWLCGMFMLEKPEPDSIHRWALKYGYHYENKEYFMAAPSQAMAQTGLWLPEVAQINNPRLLEALRINLQQLGVSLYEGIAVERLQVREGRFQCIQTASADFTGATAILATGAWTRELMPELPVRPVRGQMLCYQGKIGQLDHIIIRKGIYLIPRRDGRILVGSTVEEVGFDTGTTTRARKLLSETAETLLPGINALPLIGHWSGLRSAVTGNTPVISAHPEIKGLYINTGQFRNGILLAPGSARIIGDKILDRPQTIPASGFDWPDINVNKGVVPA